MAIEHYLTGLNERGELDVLLRNLLIAEGFEVIKRARRGEKEFGVDVAAVRPEQDGLHLYLFQVKKGDLDRSTWDDGANSVRASLSEAIDAPYTSFAKLSRFPVKRHLITVFNGEVREDARRMYEGYIETEVRRHDDLEITYWNLSTLVDRTERALVGEGLMPGVDTMLLKKTLAFADVPHYEFAEFKRLLQGLYAQVKPSPAAIRRLLATVRLLTRMAAEYARRGDTYRNAVLASEIALLSLADWASRTRTFKIKAEYQRLLEDYADDLEALVRKLEVDLTLEHGLALGGPQESVEYPLRTFEVMGCVAMLVLVAEHLGNRKQADWACNLLASLINQNPAAHRPLLDGHGIDIALAALAFAFSGRQAEAARYASWVLANLGVRADLGQPLPELYNNVDAVIETEAYKRPGEYVDSSSTLIPLLYELLLFDEDTDKVVQSFAGKFDQINLQTWYPPSVPGPELYRYELRNGVLEAGMAHPVDRVSLLGSVRASQQRYEAEEIDEPFTDRINGMMVFVAWRHLRTPVFPRAWRMWIVEGLSSGEGS